MLGIKNGSFKNKNVLVAGGSLTAFEFIKHAIDADATISLVCPRDGLCAELLALASNGEIAWLNAFPQPHHLEGKIAVFLGRGHDHLIGLATSRNIAFWLEETMYSNLKKLKEIFKAVRVHGRTASRFRTKN